jgi:hypothetical protein
LYIFFAKVNVLTECLVVACEFYEEEHPAQEREVSLGA